MGVYGRRIRPILSKVRHKIPDRTDITYWKLYRARNRDIGTIRSTKILDYKVNYSDPLTFFYEFMDIFKYRIYHFESTKRSPFIIDAGSCIGLSILYFKHIHPESRIIGFEPDPKIYRILHDNMAANKLSGLKLINAALSSDEGEHTFYVDGSDGGSLVFNSNKESIRMKTQKLSRYINEPVDFLKINIEGSELEVLTEISHKLSLVNEIVLEYHMFDTDNQDLHKILDLLNRHGFMYMINDFDSSTNPMTKTPFRMKKETKYFLLIYAKKRQDNGNS
jgi:FkbM family methyltransferase